MKVLQTIGVNQATRQAGIFQYKRVPEGVFIDASVGRAKLDPAQVLITPAEWRRILQAIHDGPATYRLSSPERTHAGQLDNLPDLIARTFDSTPTVWSGDSSWLSYICAILEYEGSVDIYGGSAGRGVSMFVPLRKDLQIPVSV